jgi:serine/threonine-protein kinase HipA
LTVCAICLEPGPDDELGRYHQACLTRLFGTERCPDLDLDLRSLPERVRETHSRMSISGAQRKALLLLSADRRRLLLPDDEDTAYILKPQTERWSSLPENESVSMCLAGRLGMRVPRFGLIALRDGSWAYIVRRFDRSDDDPPRKRDQWDLCQLLGRSPELKAEGSAEECARVVQRDTADPRAALRELFLLFVGCYWLGNGDLHLKNISLLADDDGHIALSPVYDIVCTMLYGINAPLLRMSGATSNLQWSHFVDFGVGSCGLTREDALVQLERVRSLEAEASAVIDRSLLREEYKRPYKDALRKRSRVLRVPPPPVRRDRA